MTQYDVLFPKKYVNNNLFWFKLEKTCQLHKTIMWVSIWIKFIFLSPLADYFIFLVLNLISLNFDVVFSEYKT